HSRGARARAAAKGPNDTVSDYTLDAGDQTFERQVTTERSAFENARAASPSGSQRSSYGSNAERGNGRDRERGERQGDEPSDHRPFSGRDEI
ncbi:MAG TPA: hypothetical protein VLU46_08330, partial [Thermoanaerobaculia bacterium]|nr:hypothetical protein [Thermoanaerobaculia bacterium]